MSQININTTNNEVSLTNNNNIVVVTDACGNVVNVTQQEVGVVTVNTGFGGPRGADSTVPGPSGSSAPFSYVTGSTWNTTSSIEITGSLNSPSITGSLLGTSSWSNSSSFYPSPFPFTGSAQITGSLGITGSLQITGSITSSLLIGTNTRALGNLSQVRIQGNGTGLIDIGDYSGARGAIWINQTTPSATNWALSGDTSNNTFFNGGSSVRILIAGNIIHTFLATSLTFGGNNTNTGAVIPYSFQTPSNTGQTATTEIPNFVVSGSSKTWLTGNITRQRWNYFPSNNFIFGGPSVVTSSYTIYAEAATLGTAATCSRNFAGGFSGSVDIIGNQYITGSQFISGSLKMTASSSLELPLTASVFVPNTGSIYFSGSFLFVWNGTRYMSASLA